MKTKTEMLKRACWWVIPLQGLFVALILATRDNSSVVWALWPLYLLLILVNLPGGLPAVKLGLASPGGLNPAPSPYPVASDVVTFGVSTLFWAALLWWFQIRANPPCLQQSEDGPKSSTGT